MDHQYTSRLPEDQGHLVFACKHEGCHKAQLVGAGNLTPDPRHSMLSYHRVREANAVKILDFYWCSSNQNKSDILSKHCKHAKLNDIIRELFDYQGEISLLKPA